MSIQKSVLLCLYVSVSFLFCTGTGIAASETFVRNLTLGDSGADVRALQVLLNKNSATRIAAVGPGSLGQETTYYGTLTAAAVRRYQELHRQEILVPAGLFAGTGFFGPSTRRFANGGVKTDAAPVSDTQTVDNKYGTKYDTSTETQPAFSMAGMENFNSEEDPDKEVKEIFKKIVARTKPAVITHAQMELANKDTKIVPATSATPTTTRAVMNLTREQNQDNTEWFIEFLEEGGYLDDMDEGTKSLVKAQIRVNAKKDPDTLIREYEEQNAAQGLSWRIPQVQKQQKTPPLKTPLSKLTDSIVGIFKPNEANAYFMPIFGGSVYYRFYCWGSNTWAIVIGLPMPAWLGYTYVQAYAYWQFPFSVWAKGWYVPGAQTCYIWVGYVYTVIPTMGAMSYFMGTSMP